MGAHAALDDAALARELSGLLAAQSMGSCPTLADFDDALTAGYARSLQLEAERMRLEKRITDVAAVIAAGADGDHTGELASLSRRIGETDAALNELRALLSSLRVRASEIRAA